MLMQTCAARMKNIIVICLILAAAAIAVKVGAQPSASVGGDATTPASVSPLLLKHQEESVDASDDDEEVLEQAIEEETLVPPAAVWMNAYVPSAPDTCNGTITGFSKTSLPDADCLVPFTVLLQNGTKKVRFGCFKCPSEIKMDLFVMPYIMCDGQPIYSDFSLAYYRCFLANDASTGLFSCLMETDFTLEVEQSPLSTNF